MSSLHAVTQILPSQEEKVVPPDPVNLELLWWQYFDVEASLLPSRVESFITQLKTIATKTTPENQGEVFSLTSKIEASLRAFLQAKNQAPAALPPASAHADHYSIEQTVEIGRLIRIKNALFKTEQDNLIDMHRQFEVAQQHLEKLIQHYRKLDGKNESKLLAGLKFISFQIPLEIAKLRITFLKKTLENGEEEVKRLKQTYALASGSLKSNLDQRERIAHDLKTAENSWTTALAELKDKEIVSSGTFNFGQMTEKAKLENQHHQYDLLQARIKEATTYNHFLYKQIEFHLVMILEQPQEVNIGELGQSVKKWQHWIEQILQRSRDWERLIQRELQRPEASGLGETSYETKAITNLRQQLASQIQNAQTAVQYLTNEIEDNRALLELLSKHYAITKGFFAKWVSDSSDFLIDTVQATFDLMNKVLFYIGTTPVTMISIFRCVLIMIAAFGISHFVLKTLSDIAKTRSDIKKSVLYRINRLVHYLILLLGALLALSSIGFDFSNLALIAGALGVGLGFGLQSIFNNFISGIIILFESQLKVGDLVELESGLRGEVKEINVRSTHIKTSDGIAVIVPNSEFIEGKVVNWTLEDPYRRVHIPFSVAYHSDKDLVTKVVEEAALHVRLTMPTEMFPPPKVYLTKLGDHGLDYELAVWIDDTVAKGNLLPFSLYSHAIHDALTRHGIEISTPLTEIHLSRLLDQTKLETVAQWLKPKNPLRHAAEFQESVRSETFHAN